jgi:HEPN domain-containing protein
MPATPDVSSWWSIARRDLDKARRDLAGDDIPYAVVNLQQAAEKALKASLLSRGWPLAKIHDCAALAHELTSRGVDVAWFAETGAILRDEYFSERYPGWSGEAGATRAEAEAYLENVSKLFDQLAPSPEPLATSP